MDTVLICSKCGGIINHIRMINIKDPELFENEYTCLKCGCIKNTFETRNTEIINMD